MSENYTESELEELLFLQLQKLRGMNNLLRLMQCENELLEKANEKLRSEIASRKKTPSKNTKKRNT